MELHAVNGVLAVPQSHYNPIVRPGADLEAVWQAVAHHRQRVIADGGKWLGQALKKSLTIVVNE